jgi:hypothetical protein
MPNNSHDYREKLRLIRWIIMEKEKTIQRERFSAVEDGKVALSFNLMEKEIIFSSS